MSDTRHEPAHVGEELTGTPLGAAGRLERSHADRRAGVVVTCAHDNGAPFVTFHAEGSPHEALERAIARVDGLGEGWHIVTISNPSTIYRDLQGTRANESRKPRVSANHNTRKPFSDDPRTAEVVMLGRMGRLDLLRPLPFKRADTP